jgi:hypothetical protein
MSAARCYDVVMNAPSPRPMRHVTGLLSWAALVMLVGLLTGCGSTQDDQPPPNLFATIEAIPGSAAKLEIKDAHWMPLGGANGFGEFKNSLYFWATLAGDGPVYANPDFHENIPDHCTYVGTITVDSTTQSVTINLRRAFTQAGKPDATEPCPANGRYDLKSIKR